MGIFMPRLLVVNICWLSSAAWAMGMGYTSVVVSGDKSMMSYLIAAIVAGSVAASFYTGKHLLRAAWLCSALGFLGTLIGIMAGMAGGHDLTSTAGLLATGSDLFSGVGTAFISTIVGTFGMIWIWTLAQVRGDTWVV